MNRIILFSLMSLFLCISCSDDDGLDISTLPAGIQDHVSANYPDHTIDEAEGDFLCDGTAVYEVELESSSDELELVFDTEGSFLYSETEIKSSELPAEITSSINAAYPNASLDDEAERLESPDGALQYEVEVKDGSTELEVLLDADGTVICEQEDTE